MRKHSKWRTPLEKCYYGSETRLKKCVKAFKTPLEKCNMLMEEFVYVQKKDNG